MAKIVGLLCFVEMDSSRKREGKPTGESSKTKGKIAIEDVKELGLYDDLVEQPTDSLILAKKGSYYLLLLWKVDFFV